jgi:hypothetical protein
VLVIDGAKARLGFLMRRDARLGKEVSEGSRALIVRFYTSAGLLNSECER